MTFITNNIQFTNREKQLQEILKSDERFLEFLKDKDVNRRKLIDEKGRKVDVKGFVDLKKKYGLTNKDLKIEKKKKDAATKESKKMQGVENSADHSNVTQETLTLENNKNAEVDANPDSSVNTGEAVAMETEEPTSESRNPMTNVKEIPRPDCTAKGKTNSPQKTIEKLKKKISPKVIKKVKITKTQGPKMSKEEIERFKRMMEKRITMETKEAEKDEKGNEQIHKEFTFTVSGPDEPQSGDDYSEDEARGKKNGKKKGNFKRNDKKLSEAEKTDILLLTMDTTSVKRSDVGDDSPSKRGKRKKRKTMIREEVEREVSQEDYEQILASSRFKSLRENSAFTIEDIKANAIKKRLLTKGN